MSRSLTLEVAHSPQTLGRRGFICARNRGPDCHWTKGMIDNLHQASPCWEAGGDCSSADLVKVTTSACSSVSSTILQFWVLSGSQHGDGGAAPVSVSDLVLNAKPNGVQVNFWTALRTLSPPFLAARCQYWHGTHIWSKLTSITATTTNQVRLGSFETQTARLTIRMTCTEQKSVIGICLCFTSLEWTIHTMDGSATLTRQTHRKCGLRKMYKSKLNNFVSLQSRVTPVLQNENSSRMILTARNIFPRRASATLQCSSNLIQFCVLFHPLYGACHLRKLNSDVVSSARRQNEHNQI